MLEANLRYDGTSRFRNDQRWNWFPSFSAGWNIARENFWGKDLQEIVSVLKLRASYGKLGNQNTSNLYPTYQTMSVNVNSGSWLQNGRKTNEAYSPGLISAFLTWEKIYTRNVGLDVTALKNRLTASFDYYIRETKDMIGPPLELPNILGKTPPVINNTELRTKGFELEIAWRDQLKSGLSYSARFLLSDYKGVVTKYPNQTKSLSNYYDNYISGNIWGFETIGIAKSNEEMAEHLASLPNGGQDRLGSEWAAGDIMYRDLNNDGVIDGGANTLDDHGDYRVIGNSTPRFQFGLDLNASWKGFDLRTFFQGVGKRDYITTTSKFFGCNSWGFWSIIGLKQHEDYFRAEPSNDLPANLDAYYPRPFAVGNDKNLRNQTRWLQDASYCRLKNLTLGYTLPQEITRKFYVNGLRLFVSGENVWTLTRMSSIFDPEAIDASYNTQNSGEMYPIQKVWAVGLNITL